MDIDKLKPDASGKYSPLLYKWLSSKRFRNARQVFQSGSDLDLSVFSDHWRPRNIIVCTDYHDGLVGGRRLSDIICGVHGVKSQGFAYSVRGFNLRDITDQFWSVYERIGRCAWDHRHSMHMIGDDSRWHYIAGGRQRECKWCGKVFESETKTIVEVKERTTWSEYRASVPATLLVPCDDMGREVAP